MVPLSTIFPPVKPITENFNAFTETIYNMSFEFNIPVYPIMNFSESTDVPLIELMGDHPFAIYQSIEPVCRALGAMARYYEYREKLGK